MIEPTNHPRTAAIATRASAMMPAAPQPFEPAGSGPRANQPRGVMNLQSTINPLTSSDVGGTAGHVAAACVSACGECDCERVRDARDASCILSPTTQSSRARQVVVPHGTVSVMLCTGTAPPLPPPPLQAAAAALVLETLPRQSSSLWNYDLSSP